MEKCRREMDKLYMVACTSEKQYYTSEKCDGESYFIKRDGDDDAYIREYGFETLLDLKSELSKMWDGDEVMQNCMQAVLVASLKMKPSNNSEEERSGEQCSNGQHDKKLSPFVYNF